MEDLQSLREDLQQNDDPVKGGTNFIEAVSIIHARITRKILSFWIVIIRNKNGHSRES